MTNASVTLELSLPTIGILVSWLVGLLMYTLALFRRHESMTQVLTHVDQLWGRITGKQRGSDERYKDAAVGDGLVEEMKKLASGVSAAMERSRAAERQVEIFYEARGLRLPHASTDRMQAVSVLRDQMIDKGEVPHKSDPRARGSLAERFSAVVPPSVRFEADDTDEWEETRSGTGRKRKDPRRD